MGEAGRAIIAIVSSAIGLSLVAVILSQRANTATVIGASGNALAQVLGAATAPVTGATGGFAGSSSSLGGLGSVAGGLLGNTLMSAYG